MIVSQNSLQTIKQFYLANIPVGEVAFPLLCGEPGLCQGITIHRESADTTTECQDACTNFTGCNYYTYDPTIAECFMFDTCPSVDNTLCPDCVSGSPGCDSSNEDGNIHHGTCGVLP